MARARVYVASPLGFTEPGVHYLTEVLHPAFDAAGFEVLDPWADPDSSARATLALAPGPARVLELEALNHRLGAANVAAIESSDLVLAVLDGPDIDSGTAAEIGFAAARGRPVVGLRTDTRLSGDNEAAVVNLQVLYFISASGGSLERSVEAAVSSALAVVSGHDDRDATRTRLGEDSRTDQPTGERFIYHLTLRETWEAAVEAGTYDSSTREATLAEVGFIHASFRSQLAATSARFFADVPPRDLVVLEIDPRRVTVPIRLEPASGGELFPHLYGPLNLDAVTALLPPP